MTSWLDYFHYIFPHRNFEHTCISIILRFWVSAIENTEKWSDSYPGPKAFSENESRAMANFVKSKSLNLEYYIAFHSYGEYMIIPYGYSKEHLDNFDEVVGESYVIHFYFYYN